MERGFVFSCTSVPDKNGAVVNAKVPQRVLLVRARAELVRERYFFSHLLDVPFYYHFVAFGGLAGKELGTFERNFAPSLQIRSCDFSRSFGKTALHFLLGEFLNGDVIVHQIS